MRQASLNSCNKDIKGDYNAVIRQSNGYYLSGVIFFLIVIGTIIFSIWILFNWMKDVDQLPMSKLVISGDRHYTSNDDIRKIILTIGKPGTFMTMDIHSIYDKIKSIPWIKKVTVRKQWPDEIKIYLEEHKPYAKWNQKFFINSEGVVFSLPELSNSNLKFLMLYGPKGSQHEVLAMYRIMQKQLSPHNFEIKSVYMTARRTWKLVLENDLQLKIGKQEQDIKIQLNRFIEIYPRIKQITDKRIRYIDLRYSSGAAVGWVT